MGQSVPVMSVSMSLYSSLLLGKIDRSAQSFHNENEEEGSERIPLSEASRWPNGSGWRAIEKI